MSKDEALRMALESLETIYASTHPYREDGSSTLSDESVKLSNQAITVIKEALAQPEQRKYRRGDRLRCLETDDVCVVHISGDKTQLVKFPDGDVLDYTNEQVAELFDLIPKEPEWLPEDMAYLPGVLTNFCSRCGKRLMSALGPVSIHTCCPPQGRTFDDYGNKIV